MQHPLTILFMGPQGSGKGTQVDLLQKKIETIDTVRPTVHFQVGEKFRELSRNATPTGEMIKVLLDAGALPPEFLPVWMWTDFFINALKGNEHVLLDGAARRVSEAIVLDGALRFYSRTALHVVSIEISSELAMERMQSRGRGDDFLDNIKNRLAWYDEHVKPVAEFYRQNSRYTFHKINGDQPIDVVHDDICKALRIGTATT